jgi:hypothetical protein
MPKQQFVIFSEGEKVFIRTVTNFLVGQVVGTQNVGDNTFIVLGGASWIADTRRFSDFLKDGITENVEVEPVTGICAVNVGSIVDVFEWNHELPTKQQ